MNFCKDCKYYDKDRVKCLRFDEHADPVSGRNAGINAYNARRCKCFGEKFEPKPRLLDIFIKWIK